MHVHISVAIEYNYLLSGSLYVCFHSVSDTVSRSGVYCAVSIALEQCKAEGVVDVFQVTKGLKRSKPGAITTIVMI